MALIDVALEKINEAWKNASEEMYKAQAESANLIKSTKKLNQERKQKKKEEMMFKMLISKRLKIN